MFPARSGKGWARTRGALEMMIQKRHPTGGDLEKAEFQAGKFFWNLAGHEIAKTDERRQMRRRESSVQFEIEEIQ